MPAIPDITLTALFTLIGGTFMVTEMTLVALRESRVRQLAARGKRGRTIERLTNGPNRFLSAVRIGTTLSGFLSTIFGGATLAVGPAPVLKGWGISASVADPLALAIITIVISYSSIVIGELNAKRLATRRAEGFVLALVPLVFGIASLARFAIWLLGVPIDAVMRVSGGNPKLSKNAVGDKEL